jgi:phosphoglycolate phosphatase-like HAD superfamily hydrolase
MVVDFKAANNANIDFIYANYGYGNYKKNFYKIIKKPKEIIKYIK